jgi:hypothetical protein
VVQTGAVTHRGLFAIGVLLYGLTIAQGATAQPGRLFPLEVDRPGEANPPTVLAPGTFQIETGLKLEAETDDDDPDRRTLTFPDALLRLGLFERAELRLSAAGLLTEFRDGADDRALGSDLDLSAKARLWHQRAFLPATGVELGLSFPVGSKAETSGGFALRVGRSMMLDLSGGGGLTRAAPDWFVALGFSVRFRDLWGD